MNSITELLNLEDSDIYISNISIEGTTKTLTLETKLYSHYCPSCGYRMYSRGVKKRTIKHPILQDNYELVLILKQRRWMCTNPECKYNISFSKNSDSVTENLKSNSLMRNNDLFLCHHQTKFIFFKNIAGSFYQINPT